MNESSSPLYGAIKLIQMFMNKLENYKEWYRNNAETIFMYASAFADFGIWLNAVNKLAENQIVFTDDLSYELAKVIYNSSNVDEVIKKYYFENDGEHITRLIVRCQNASQVSEYITLYFQIIEAYKRDHHNLACNGLFSLLDGVLSDVTNRITDTNFRRRIKIIKDKVADKVELNDIDRKTLCIYNSVNSIMDSMFADSRFSDDEPKTLNRHWVIHSRTRRLYTQYDFLKILLFLDAIIFLSNINTQQN